MELKLATEKDWPIAKQCYLNTDGGPVYNAFIGGLTIHDPRRFLDTCF